MKNYWQEAENQPNNLDEGVDVVVDGVGDDDGDVVDFVAAGVGAVADVCWKRKGRKDRGEVITDENFASLKKNWRRAANLYSFVVKVLRLERLAVSEERPCKARFERLDRNEKKCQK